ncbi:MAG: hypothetical protein M1819_000172 [Sarea resinae]|nr:MAG: hypothetical protein M1819_000172 [Sarea resinae]
MSPSEEQPPRDHGPARRMTPPTSPAERRPAHDEGHGHQGSKLLRFRSRRMSVRSKEDHNKHIRVEEPSSSRAKPFGSSIYLGSYSRNPFQSRISLDSRRSGSVAAFSPRPSGSHDQLDLLLQQEDADLETYGMEELRDGFFDATFLRPMMDDLPKFFRSFTDVNPAGSSKRNPLSLRHFLPDQWRQLRGLARHITSRGPAIQLLKSFLGFFVAYIICLIPASRDWLGRYNYILAISTILNHSGRSIGSQLDGALLTISGTALGLGWGSLGLYVSTSTSIAREGYGGILATFLVVFVALVAWIRCVFIRFYQAVLCAGLAAVYTCLANTSESVGWRKVFDYGVPWVLGQAICLVIAFVVFPDAGSPAMATALHKCLSHVRSGLDLPRPERTGIRRTLSWDFVALSQAVRDFTIDVTVSRLRPDDIRELRNLIQGVIRAVLSLRASTTLFDKDTSADRQLYEDATRGSGPESDGLGIHRLSSTTASLSLVRSVLAPRTRTLIDAMCQSVEEGDAALLEIAGYRKQAGASTVHGHSLPELLSLLRRSTTAFDDADASLIDHPKLPRTYTNHPEVVELFLFAHPVRESANKIEAFLVKVLEMQEKRQGWRVFMPSYPFNKSLLRTNAQVRHDRGGLTAGFYFRSKRQLEKTMRDLQSTAYKPTPRPNVPSSSSNSKGADELESQRIGKYQEEKEVAMDKNQSVPETTRLRYRIWMVLHRLQGFESRFAFKAGILTTLLAIPAWLHQSRGWWNENDSWWAVAMAWMMMHPRVGGNFQDLVTRALCAVLGALWGGLAYRAGNGSPYVLGVFAAIFMLPMLYRFTQSTHPRSGIVGCIAYTIVSLSAYTAHSHPHSHPHDIDASSAASVAKMAWTRGVALMVGVVAAGIVNWVLWPFVARHELRKSLSTMMLHLSILYRGMVARYIYFEVGQEPGRVDIERSEMLEGRLREGFVRIRQLMELTRHEIRLRGPFDPTPYSHLINTSERFFSLLIAVRQSSLYFHPYMLPGRTNTNTSVPGSPSSPSSPSTEKRPAGRGGAGGGRESDSKAGTRARPTNTTIQSLLSVRRDAVAPILMGLYILAGALRGGRQVPRYLPSAAVGRRRLLDRMAEVEASFEDVNTNGNENGNGNGNGNDDNHNGNVDGDNDGDNDDDDDGVDKKSNGERKWADVYRYAYSSALTDIVAQLEQLQRWTKVVCGEVGFEDSLFEDDDYAEDEDEGEEGGRR